MSVSSPTGGVKPMAIAGRTVRERERLVGMTDKERAWRAQWLKDQILSPNEPRFVPELYRAHMNPLRRFYRAPLDAAARALEPKLGSSVHFIRNLTGKFLMTITLVCSGMYYMKYNRNNWERLGGWRKIESRVAVVPGDPGYPALPDRHCPSDYGDRGFNKCKVNFK